MDVICDLKIKYSTLLGELFGWILQGPIEGHKFEVNVAIEVSEELTTDFSSALEIFEINTQTYHGDYTWKNILFQDKKFHRSKSFVMNSLGAMEIRLFLSSDCDFNIMSRDGTIQTNEENKTGYTVIPKGSRFFFKPLRVHRLTDVLIIILTIISSIGAIFEILSFILKT